MILHFLIISIYLDYKLHNYTTVVLNFRWLRSQDPPCLRDRGDMLCPWDELRCATAAEIGLLNFLRWLRSPRDREIFYKFASRCQNFEELKQKNLKAFKTVTWCDMMWCKHDIRWMLVLKIVWTALIDSMICTTAGLSSNMTVHTSMQSYNLV